MAEQRRTLPGWVAPAGYGLLATSAVGLPTALAVAALDSVERTGSTVAQRVVLGALVLLAVGVVVAGERGLAWVAREQGIRAALGYVAGALALVAVAVLVRPVGLVLLAVLVVLAVPLALVGIGYLAWWRWQHGPRPAPRVAPTTAEVRARAEQRREVVRARHERTREAVARGLIGPGYTRGR